MRLPVCCLLVLLLPGLCGAEDMSSLLSLVQNENRWPTPGREALSLGIDDWNHGRYLSARNNWVRAQGWMGRSAEAGAPPREALAALVAEADRLSQPALEPTPEPVPSPTPEVKPARCRARARRPAAPRPVGAAAIMERARVAQAAGQTEKALRLMRIASGLPGGEAASAAAEALERELLQPAR